MADDFEMGFTSSESNPSLFLNCLILCFPLSMTNRTPGTVTDVSAMLVEITILRVLGGAGRKTCCCADCGSAAKRGRVRILVAVSCGVREP